MTLRELGGSKAVKVTGALALLAGAIFLPVLLEPAGLGLFAPVGGVLLAYGSIALLGRVPEVKRIVPPVLLKALPGLDAWFVREREIAERRRVADDMEATLRFYGAEGLDGVPWGEVEAELVADSDLAGKDSEEIVAACARRLATVLSLPPEVLELLHHERNATVPLWLWPLRPEIRGRVLPALARVLARSRIVRRHLGPGLELEGPELEGVLEGLPSFELEALLTELQVHRDGWRTGQAFWAFLGGNFSGLGDPPAAREMVPSGQGAGGRDGVPVLDGLARRAVRAWRQARADTPALTETEREAVAVLAEILFFVRSGLSPLQQGLAPRCERLADLDGGVALAWVYLVAKQEFRDELWGERERYLRLDLFLERRPEILERRPAKPDEVAVLKEALEAGDWLISRQELLGRLAARGTAEQQAAGEAPEAARPAETAGTAEAAATGEARAAALPARPAAARRREPSEADRVERLTEAQGVRTYLITLGRSAGPVPRILDELAKSNPGRYDFEQYTPFSRIGIVPRGVAFIDFCTALRADLEARLGPPSENGDRSSYEVLVHAFQPAESNPFVIGEGEKPAMQTVREILASRRLGSAEDRA